MDSKPEGVQAPGEAVAPPRRILLSGEVFEGGREVGILHDGALYRLSVTRQGKLILTK